MVATETRIYKSLNFCHNKNLQHFSCNSARRDYMFVNFPYKPISKTDCTGLWLMELSNDSVRISSNRFYFSKFIYLITMHLSKNRCRILLVNF